MGDQSVRRWNAYKPGDERQNTEQEEVPVEAWRLDERELGRLGDQGRHVVVEREQLRGGATGGGQSVLRMLSARKERKKGEERTHDEEDKAEREGDPNPLSLQLPKGDEPRSSSSRLKRTRHGQSRTFHVDALVCPPQRSTSASAFDFANSPMGREGRMELTKSTPVSQP